MGHLGKGPSTQGVQSWAGLIHLHNHPTKHLPFPRQAYTCTHPCSPPLFLCLSLSPRPCSINSCSNITYMQCNIYILLHVVPMTSNSAIQDHSPSPEDNFPFLECSHFKHCYPMTQREQGHDSSKPQKISLLSKNKTIKKMSEINY